MPTSLPKISIVTPSFNQGVFLEEAMLSVLDQGYPNLEYFVLDGGSSDGSVEVINKHSGRLTLWRSGPDSGQAAALREGFEMATGDILGWLNSDDLLAPGALMCVAEAWIENGPELVVAGGCQVFGREPEPPAHFPRFQVGPGPEPFPVTRMLDMAVHWFPGEFFYQPEVFFPRKAYFEVGGIDPSFFYTMDYDLWMRMALHGLDVVVLPEILAWYREHPGQKTADLEALHREMVRTANRYLKDARVQLSPMQKRVLAVSNMLALRPITRRAAQEFRRLLSG